MGPLFDFSLKKKMIFLENSLTSILANIRVNFAFILTENRSQIYFRWVLQQNVLRSKIGQIRLENRDFDKESLKFDFD